MMGYIGVSLILSAMLWGEYKERGAIYYGLNGGGSLFLLVHSANNNDAPFFILNLIWLAVSLNGLYKNT